LSEVVSSLIASIISEYAKKIVEKASQGKRITAPELMVLIMSEMDRRLTTQIQELDRRLTSQILELDKRLTTQIETLRREFNGRFKGLEDRIKALELRVDGLEKRIDDLKFYIDQYHRETMDRIRRIEEKLGIT